MGPSVRFRFGVGLLCRVAGVGAALAAALTLAACGGGTKDAVGSFFQAGAEQKEIDPELIRPAVQCPPVTVQLGTEALRRTSGEGAEEKLRWQASITKTARECRKTEAGTAMRVGVSGRIVEGALGGPSRFELPVRIAVREGSETTYTKLHKVTVERTGTSQSWALVDEGIVVKQPNITEILVGFDGG